jgi:hypothetical protein
MLQGVSQEEILRIMLVLSIHLQSNIGVSTLEIAGTLPGVL